MQVKPLLYSQEEYFKLEETAEFKHEYRDGDIIPMSGGTTNHNQILRGFLHFLTLCSYL
jgi:Uma2 family endonuclease